MYVCTSCNEDFEAALFANYDSLLVMGYACFRVGVINKLVNIVVSSNMFLLYRFCYVDDMT